jgi:flagellar assembly protein FliH
MTGKPIVRPQAMLATVLRNAMVDGPVQKLARPDAMPAAAPVPQALVQLPESTDVPTPVVDQRQLDEAFRAGREQGLDDGKRQILESALAQERERARNEGLEQGREEGKRAAQQAAAASANEALATLERLLAVIPDQLNARFTALEEDMVALSFEMLARVLGETAATQDGLRALLRQALEQYGPRRLMEIRVHPGDLECLATDEMTGAWLRQRESGQDVQFVADASIELGGVVLRSPAGRLDARLETQLAALRRALSSVRAARAGMARQQARAELAPVAQGGAR